MKVKILRNTVADKKPLYIGQVIELPEYEAHYLITRGRAVLFKEGDAAASEPEAPLPVPQPKRKVGRPRKIKKEVEGDWK